MLDETTAETLVTTLGTTESYSPSSYDDCARDSNVLPTYSNVTVKYFTNAQGQQVPSTSTSSTHPAERLRHTQ